jgi:hypothetical protein
MVDFYARRLMHHTRLPGLLRLAMVGSTRRLLAAGRVDKHLRFPVGEGATEAELDVWLIRARGGDGRAGGVPAPRGTVLLVHGLWDSKGRFFRLGELLARRGFDVILPDLRRHGRSTGQHTTFGALEKRDLAALVDHLLAAGEVRGPLWVFGFSMGAAIAVQYAAIEPRVRGVVAAAPFQDGWSITRRAVPLMSQAKFRAVWARAGEIAHFDPAESSTLTAAASLHCPLVIAHGRLDLIVPYRHGRAVFQAAGVPKRFHTVWWSGHLSLLLLGRRWFADRIEEVIAMAGL